MNTGMLRLYGSAVAAAMLFLAFSGLAQQAPNAAIDPGPQISVDGYSYTQLQLFQRNIGGPNEQTTQFPPHKIIGNLYYVGTASLASFLVVTPQGNILIDSTYERNVPLIQKSVEQLGFKFSDTKILLGSHAHADHMEGDALVKQLTAAQVMAMAEDVPALEAMKPGGKPHPIDRVVHDGDEVKLGGMTLVAHLTPGHTRGCTTWTMKVQDGGKSYNVVIIGSMGVNPGVKLVNNLDVPGIADEFTRGFKTMRSLPCDVPLGSHPGMYHMQEKYAKLKQGGANPFIDPAGYKIEMDIDEAMFYAVVARQTKAAMLRGDVIDQTGGLISGVSVRLYSTERVLETKTDSNGEFVFANLFQGAYEFEASSPGFTTVRRNIEIANEPPGEIVEKLNVGTGGHCPVTTGTASGTRESIDYEKRFNNVDLMGLVHDDLGAEISGVTLTMSAEGKSQTAESDSKGEFSFVGLAPGKYALRLTYPDHGEVQRGVWITRENMVRVVLGMPDSRRVPCFEDLGRKE